MADPARVPVNTGADSAAPSETPPLTRAEAKARGLKTYSGKPCKRGHIGTRRVSGGGCVECACGRQRSYWRQYKSANREKIREHHRRWREAHRGQDRERKRQYRAENLEKIEDYQRYYRKNKKNRDRARWRQIKLLYGLTQVAWESLFAAQGGVCAICRTENPGRCWCTDHCHDTNLVRGILCHHCNTTLGNVKDNPETLERAAAYLRKARSESAGAVTTYSLTNS